MKRKLIPLRLDPATATEIDARAVRAGVSRQAYLESLVGADLELRQRADEVREREKIRRAIHGLEKEPEPRDRSGEDWRGKFTSPAAAQLNARRKGRPEQVWTDAEKRSSGFPPYYSPRCDPLSRRAAFARSFIPPGLRPRFRDEDWLGGSSHIGPHVHIPSQD